MERPQQKRNRPKQLSKFDSLVSTNQVSAATVEQQWQMNSGQGGMSMVVWDIDMHPSEKLILTAGSDGTALVWQVVRPAANSSVAVSDFELKSLLMTDPQTTCRGCNAAKWAPSGDLIVSGYESGHAYIWREAQQPPTYALTETITYGVKAHWKILVNLSTKKCNSRHNEITAIEWTPDQSCVLGSTSLDGAFVWDAFTGSVLHHILDHQCRISAVAVHPFCPEVLTIGEDLKVNFYRLMPARRGTTEDVDRRHPGAPALKRVRQVCTDTAKGLLDQEKFCAYVRHVEWSTDGVFVVFPESFQRQRKTNAKGKVVLDDSDSEASLGMSDLSDIVSELRGMRVYLKGRYQKALGFIPAPPGLTAVCVKFAPTRYAHGPSGEDKAAVKIWGKLPYRMVYAVSMLDKFKRSGIMVYDTAHTTPLLEITNLSIGPMTRLVWSHDCDELYASSHDGFVSSIALRTDTLGTEYVATESEV